MKNVKELNDRDLLKVTAGSNDGFWTGVGYVAGIWWEANKSYNYALKKGNGYKY